MIPMGHFGVCVAFIVTLGAISTFASDVITFSVTWPNGTVTSFSYRKTKSGDCLYDSQKYWLTCMMSYDYQEIRKMWTERPQEILYVSVQCQEQSSLQVHPHVCFCQHPAYPPPPHRPLAVPTSPLDFCQVEELSAAMFARLRRLEALDLSDNVLHEIPRDVFEEATSLRFLSLSFNPLRALPDGMACSKPQLQVLLLRHLAFETFPDNIFRCEDDRNSTFPLRFLDMSQSHVTDLGRRGLQGLRHLELLNLSVNLLQEVPDHALRSASSLRYLDLSHNFLAGLPPSLCSSLGRLESLDLVMNVFDVVNFTLLKGCRSLTSLDISENTVVSLAGLPLSFPSLRTLRLAGNQIRNLTEPFWVKGDNSSLRELDLSRNLLDLLEDDAFQGMSKLEILNLSGNVLNAQASLARVFWPLTSLRVLDLSHSGLTSLPERAFSPLGELRQLMLCHNYLVTLGDATLSGLRRLDSLHLQDNMLKSLGRAVMAPLVSVTLVNLSDNALSRVEFTRPIPALSVLDISLNRLEVFPSGLRGVELRRLDLHGNQITWLERGVLSGLPNLERLDLYDNKINGVDTGVFLASSSLRQLDLSDNVISTPVGSDTLRGAGKLEILDLSNNSIPLVDGLATPLPRLRFVNVSFNAMKELRRLLDMGSQSNSTLHVDLSHCQLRQVGVDAFAGMTTLMTVDLRWNQLAAFPRFLGARAGVQYDLRNNAVVCSCDMAWYALHEVHVPSQKLSATFAVDVCSTLPRGWRLPMASLRPEQFYCRQTDTKLCPEGCTCYSHGRQLEAVLADCSSNLTRVPDFLPTRASTVYLDGNDLGVLHAIAPLRHDSLAVTELYLNSSQITAVSVDAFTHFTHLIVLDLSGNRLNDLHPDTLHHVTSLLELRLRGNRLTLLRPGLLSTLTSLRLLDVSGNHLQIVTAYTITELSAMQGLKRVYLGGNPWECSCANVDFRQWLALYEERVRDRAQLFCQERPLLEMTSADLSCSQPGLVGDALQAAILLPVVSVLLMVMFAVCYFRNFVIPLVYTRCGCTCVKDDIAPTKHVTIYDVTVVHDERDVKCSWWVEHVLVPRMRQGIGRFRYNVHVMGSGSGSGLSSEFAAGGRLSVADDSLASLQLARSTLLVVSRTFPLCHSAMAYFRHAQMLSRVGSHVLRTVVLGDVTRGMLSTDLRAQLSGGDFLSPCSPLFWDRLAHSLPFPCHFSAPSPPPSASPSRTPSSSRLQALGRRGRRRSDTLVILSQLTDVTDTLGLPDPPNPAS